jgi:hypothetical protein
MAQAYSDAYDPEEWNNEGGVQFLVQCPQLSLTNLEISADSYGWTTVVVEVSNFGGAMGGGMLELDLPWETEPTAFSIDPISEMPYQGTFEGWVECVVGATICTSATLTPDPYKDPGGGEYWQEECFTHGNCAGSIL